MKKKIILSMLIVASLGLTVGCSNEDTTNKDTDKVETNTNESNEEVSEEKSVEKGTDAEFIKDVEKSTKARWMLSDEFTKKENEQVEGESFKEEEVFEYYKEFVKSETDILYKYEDSEFKDPKLEKLATDYIDGLKNQEEAFQYFYSDQEKWSNLWDEGYDKRSVSLLKLIDEYGLKADGEEIESLRQNAQKVGEDKELESKIDEMIKNIEFTPEEDSGDWKEYTAVVENTTGMEFDQFDLDIKLIDKDGVTIDTPIAQTSNWNPEEKVRFSFSTDKAFDEIKWNWKYYNN